MTLLLTLAKATAVIVAIGAAWIAVDRAWRRTFPDRESGSCGGCATCRRDCDQRAGDKT